MRRLDGICARIAAEKRTRASQLITAYQALYGEEPASGARHDRTGRAGEHGGDRDGAAYGDIDVQGQSENTCTDEEVEMLARLLGCPDFGSGIIKEETDVVGAGRRELPYCTTVVHC